MPVSLPLHTDGRKTTMEPVAFGSATGSLAAIVCDGLDGWAVGDDVAIGAPQLTQKVLPSATVAPHFPQYIANPHTRTYLGPGCRVSSSVTDAPQADATHRSAVDRREATPRRAALNAACISLSCLRRSLHCPCTARSTLPWPPRRSPHWSP